MSGIRTMAVVAVVAVVAFCLYSVVAQVPYNETVWSSVIFNRYGERTPIILPQQNVLTPLGAQQLYSAGSSFRKRYIDPPSNDSKAIHGISTYEIDNVQLNAMSAVDAYVVASAQAFIQGLYPPLSVSSNDTILNSLSVLTNGSNIDFPLGGYQYPQLYTTSGLDPNSIWLAGHANCPAYVNSRAEYLSSDDCLQTSLTNDGFYRSLLPSILEGVFPHPSVGYRSAYSIVDYLNYGYIHNRTVQNSLSATDLTKARTLADHLVYALNGNLSASGRVSGDRIRTIAGQTLAAEVVGLLFNNMDTKGTADKINVLFGDFEPFVAFAALARLPSVSTNFYGMPDFGSSMVFEMFSVDNDSSGTYPSIDKLKVRFLSRNGTNATSQLISYPLFGRARSETDMTFQDFLRGMEDIMLPSVGDWCGICGSFSIFCAAYANNTNARGANGSSNSHGGGGLKPAVAGVIGAVVALAVVGSLLALAMLLGGFRIHRLKTRRRSALGGFKGGEKLASDPDLPAGRGRDGPSSSGGKGERVGSWELGESSKTGAAALEVPERPRPPRPSFEADDMSINPLAEPVKTEERV